MFCLSVCLSTWGQRVPTLDEGGGTHLGQGERHLSWMGEVVTTLGEEGVATLDWGGDTSLDGEVPTLDEGAVTYIQWGRGTYLV